MSVVPFPAIAFVVRAAVGICVALAPFARGENADLRVEIVDAQSGRTKARLIVSAPVKTTPEARMFVYHRSVRFPKPLGRVGIVGEFYFLGFSKDAVWFGVNTNATGSGRIAMAHSDK